MKKNHTIGFLFDLDGVLIDSEKEYTRIWDEIENEIPTGKREFALSIKGQTLNKILNENYKDAETREKVSELLHNKEREMKYGYCNGAEEFLKLLSSQNYKTALVTSSDVVKMNHLYSDLPDFQHYMDVVVDASKVVNSKPDPEGYLLAADSLGLDIKRCAVFEDSVQGVKAGRASGAFVIGVVGTKSYDELLPFSDIMVNSLKEINLDELIVTLAER